MSEPIRGKVARVLNTREIALNVGTAHDVYVGMYFDVIDVHENIVDPDTNEVLGTIERLKVRVRVTHVQNKLSIATTYRSRTINVGGTGPTLGPFAQSLMPPNWVRKYETLEKNKGELAEKDSFVKIGDPVVQVTEKTE